MLFLSTKSNNVSQLNIVLHLLKSAENNVKDIITLVEMISIENISWEYKLRLSSLLLMNGLTDKAKEFISDIDHINTDVTLTSVQIFPFVVVIANCGKVEFALHIINKAYHENKNIKDGYVKLAWSYYHKKRKFKKALDLMLRDFNNFRMSPQWMIKLVEEFTMNERFHEAEKLVGIIYNKDPTLKNGYAFIGWYFFQKKNHFDKSLFFFQKDIVLERLAEDKLWQYALLLAVHGDILKSTQIIDRIKINSEKVRFCKFVTRLYYDNYIEQSLLKHSIKILEQMQAKDFYRIDITKNLVLQYYFNNQVDNAIQLIEWWEKKHDLQDKYFPRLTFSLYVLLDNNKEYSENLIKEISLEQLTDVRSLLTFSIILSVIGKLDELKESINTLYCRYPNCFIELPSWCLLFSLAAYRFKNEKLFDTYLEIGNKYKHSFSSRIDWINSIKFDLDKLFWPLPSFRLPNADFQI